MMPTDIRSLLQAARADGTPIARIRGARRQRLSAASGEILLDEFEEAGARCLFWRAAHAGDVRLLLQGTYRITTAQAGGWLVLAQDESQPSYWLPLSATLRRIDDRGRIYDESTCAIQTFEVGNAGIEVGLSGTAGHVLDLVLWEIDPAGRGICSGLIGLEALERQPVFLWGSHGTYRIPADLYRSLIQGSVFDLRFSWPHKRRSFSENEAHALHLALRNRELASGKSLYRRLRDQVLLSVLARQDVDGAWRQGIWTDGMECHFRLHCSALHMLMDSYCEQPDETVLAALKSGSDFIAAQATEVLGETWFLHDSLEQSLEEIRLQLRDFRECPNPEKTPGNTMVLNTHIDTLIALHRFQALTGSRSFDEQIESARRLLIRLLEMKPAETLYRGLFHALYLTLLPTERARALTLPLRALKRIARKYFIPLMTRVKCRYPRLVMPGGYIDRSLSLERLANPYHSINLMDLVRYDRMFPGEKPVRDAIAGALRFAEDLEIQAFWAEHPYPRYAIGFWIESLYLLCLQEEDLEYRSALSASVHLATELGIGLPPSLPGANCEAVPLESQVPCPIPLSPDLFAINLSNGQTAETMLINLSEREIEVSWKSALPHNTVWRISSDPHRPRDGLETLAGGAWATGRDTGLKNEYSSS